MKGFKKMDEMEQFISIKSLKIAYMFTVFFLFVWGIIDIIYNNRTSSKALLLLVTQNIILILSQLYYKKKLGD